MPFSNDTQHESTSEALFRNTILVSHQKPLEPQRLNNSAIQETRKHSVYALYDFSAEYDDELSLEEGNEIIVQRTGGRGDSDDLDWWFGEMVSTGKTGWFPKSYVSGSL